MAIKTGYLPVVKTALDTHAWKIYSNENPMAKVLVSQIPFASFDPGIAQRSSIRTIVGNAVSAAMHFKEIPEQALQYAQKQINKLLDAK